MFLEKYVYVVFGQCLFAEVTSLIAHSLLLTESCNACPLNPVYVMILPRGSQIKVASCGRVVVASVCSGMSSNARNTYYNCVFPVESLILA